MDVMRICNDHHGARRSTRQSAPALPLCSDPQHGKPGYGLGMASHSPRDLPQQSRLVYGRAVARPPENRPAAQTPSTDFFDVAR